jgi:hypothetical protein
MTRTTATTVDGYLAELPADRRAVMRAARELVQRHLPDGYRETVAYGMIAYGIPLERFPNTYNGQPLGYVALAAQKNYYALYLMGAYMEPAVDEALRAGFAHAGKKLDMGKSCVRFRALDDLALDAIGAAIAAIPPERLIELHESVHGSKAKAAKPSARKRSK